MVYQSNHPGHVTAAFDAHESLVFGSKVTVDRHNPTGGFHVSRLESQYTSTLERPEDPSSQFVVFQLLNGRIHRIRVSARGVLIYRVAQL